jgi:hypothetical protein
VRSEQAWRSLYILQIQRRLEGSEANLKGTMRRVPETAGMTLETESLNENVRIHNQNVDRRSIDLNSKSG